MSDGGPEPLVDLVVEAPEWERALPDLAEIATRAVELALEAAGLPPDGFTLCVLACHDGRMGELNRQYRGKSSPTNVLSWPAFSLAPAAAGAKPTTPPQADPGARTLLGDVAIAFGTVTREAESRRVPLKNHTVHLILHGCLHLLGYDHETPQDAELMENLERRALARAGIPDPYA